MGLEIKRVGKDRFSLRSSVSNELLHEGKSVDLKGAKEALIKRAFHDFLLEAVSINRTFPARYTVDGRFQAGDSGKLELLDVDPTELWNEIKGYLEG